MDQCIKNEWCIENDFAAQRELAAIEEARGFREIEKLRAQLAESEARVKELQEALEEIAWSDELASHIARKALEATCSKQ